MLYEMWRVEDESLVVPTSYLYYRDLFLFSHWRASFDINSSCFELWL